MAESSSELNEKIKGMDNRTLLFLFANLFGFDYPCVKIEDKKEIMRRIIRYPEGERSLMYFGIFPNGFGTVEESITKTLRNIVDTKDLEFINRLNSSSLIMLIFLVVLKRGAKLEERDLKTAIEILRNESQEVEENYSIVPDPDLFYFDAEKFIEDELMSFQGLHKRVSFEDQILDIIFSGNVDYLKNAILNVFDCLYLGSNKEHKLRILKTIKSDLADLQNDSPIDWSYFDRNDDEQLNWLLSYIAKKTDFFNNTNTLTLIPNLKNEYKLTLADSILKFVRAYPRNFLMEGTVDFDDYLDDLRRAAYQKKFRAKKELVGKYHMPLTKKSKQMLTALAELEQKREYEVLEVLIAESYKKHESRIDKTKSPQPQEKRPPVPRKIRQPKSI